MHSTPLDPITLASDDPSTPQQPTLPGLEDLQAMVQEVIAEAKKELLASITPLHVPAGGNTAMVVNIDDLPTSEKIRRGLAALPPLRPSGT